MTESQTRTSVTASTAELRSFIVTTGQVYRLRGLPIREPDQKKTPRERGLNSRTKTLLFQICLLRLAKARPSPSKARVLGSGASAVVRLMMAVWPDVPEKFTQSPWGVTFRDATP